MLESVEHYNFCSMMKWHYTMQLLHNITINVLNWTWHRTPQTFCRLVIENSAQRKKNNLYQSYRGFTTLLKSFSFHTFAFTLVRQKEFPYFFTSISVTNLVVTSGSNNTRWKKSIGSHRYDVWCCDIFTTGNTWYASIWKWIRAFFKIIMIVGIEYQ